MNNLHIEDLKKFKPTHFRQLYNYLMEREAEGWYYGNEGHFEKRHQDLKAWLEKLI